MANPSALLSLNPLITCKMVNTLPCEKYSPVTPLDDLKQEIDLEEEVGLEDDVDVEDEYEADMEAFIQKETFAPEGEEAVSTADVGAATTYSWNKPCLMIVFSDGDFSSALHYLLVSLHNPFEESAVASVLIQESLIKQFVDRLSSQLKELDSQVATHPNYLRSLQKLRELRAHIVTNDELKASPVLVYDIPQFYLGNGPTGVITIRSFRTPLEATEIWMEESLPFASVSIWNERVADAYDVLARLRIDVVMINCFNVSLQPIRDSFLSKQSDVHISKGYHHETLVLNGKRKIIVFPLGTIFGN